MGLSPSSTPDSCLTTAAASAESQPSGAQADSVVTTRPMKLLSDVRTGPIDIVDEWGLGSFPASDPPSNW
jgi:hypothetical protein